MKSDIDNTFGNTLNDIRSGECLNELSEKLAEVVGRVRETGKAGTLTLTLKIKPASRGAVGALIVEDSVKNKLPELDRAASLFFSTDENTLQRNDPNQVELQFKTVTGGKVDLAKLKQVDAAVNE